ncbi:MAG: FHA domain-containing protein [Myxococcota bacterium]|jgi:pSer/pThr/pTyr-binding forkhead associated (FHA) protein|nr:FHA domain-containing protein [Myxococcota bacterium]
MAFRLTITQWQDSSSEYERGFVLDRVILGRSRGCEVCLPDMAVSTRHAEVRLVGSEYAVVDLGSVNGTAVGGKVLVAHRPHKLRSGDVVSIAGFRLRFHTGAMKPQEDRDTAVEQARTMLQRVLVRAGQSASHALVVVAGPGRGTCFELPTTPATLVIGRDRECAIRLMDDQDVSRRHVELRTEVAGVFLRDLGSRNGLTVEGRAVEAVQLVPGLCATIGRTTLALRHPTDRQLTAILDAPEEETSSFVVPQPEEPEGLEPSTSDGGPESLQGAQGRIDDKPLAIGPADPLLDTREPRAPPRTTSTLPVPPPLSPASDLALIIAGAILVAAAVAGLVVLFG